MITGKITHALKRKEADTYRSQGLPQEALRIYQELLAAAAHMPVKTQAAIREQIQQIKTEIQCNSVDECSCLSDEQIALIRQGWSAEATTEEIIVSASSFDEVGRFADDFKEFKTLIRKGVPVDRMIGPLASCLRHLHRPEELAPAVVRLAEEICADPAAGASLRVVIAEKLYQQGYFDHAASLVLGLSQTDSSLPGEVQGRLSVLYGMLAQHRSEAVEPDARPLQDGSHPSSSTGAGSHLFRSFRRFARRLAGSR